MQERRGTGQRGLKRSHLVHRSRLPEKVGDPGILTGLGKRAGWLRGAGMICAARSREPVPTGQERGHRVSAGGRTKKWPNGKGAPRQRERTREPLGDVSMTVESGELSWGCEGWGALFSPLDRFLVVPTFPPPLAPPSWCLSLGLHQPQLSALGRAEGV